MERMQENKNLTFLYTPVNNYYKSNPPLPPLAVLISENEKMSVVNLKTILLKSLNKAELKLDRVSVARISEDKYHILHHNCDIKGVKALNKFIYAFEISSTCHNYTCAICKCENTDELKLHKDYNSFVILCDRCIALYVLNKNPLECPVTIGKCAPVMSILNLPIRLITNNSDNNSHKKLGNSRLFTLTFEDNVNELSVNVKNYVHFIEKEDHECSKSCYYENGYSSENKSAREQLLSILYTQEDTLNKIDNNPNNNGNIILEKSSLQLNPSQFDQKSNKEQFEQYHTFDSFEEKFKKILEGLLEKMQEIEKLAETCNVNRNKSDLNPFENLKFSGRKDFKHPVRFIQDFEFFAVREKLNDYEKQFYLGQTFTDEAAVWLKIRGYGETYESMKESFLNFFWNNEDQNRFIAFLRRGRYNEKTKLTKFVYFHKYAYEANYLDDSPDEDLLVGWLSEHFDSFVQAELHRNRVKTINDVLNTLKDLERPEIIQESKLEIPNNFFSSSSVKKSRTGTWVDCFENKYDTIKKESETYYRCITTKIWPMHTMSYNNSMSEIKHFNVTCDENSSLFLTGVPEKLKWVFIDIKNQPADYQILGPVTIAKQNRRQLVVSTCPSFRSHKKFTSGQLLYFLGENSYVPCGIVTCSIPEDFEYRYVISNINEQIVCLLCKENIQEIEFRDSRSVAVTDLIVCYFEQKFMKNKHILRFLNENFRTIYTVWDTAVEEYDPLNPTYH